MPGPAGQHTLNPATGPATKKVTGGDNQRRWIVFAQEGTDPVGMRLSVQTASCCARASTAMAWTSSESRGRGGWAWRSVRRMLASTAASWASDLLRETVCAVPGHGHVPLNGISQLCDRQHGQAAEDTGGYTQRPITAAVDQAHSRCSSGAGLVHPRWHLTADGAKRGASVGHTARIYGGAGPAITLVLCDVRPGEVDGVGLVAFGHSSP
jgi:hypothetical protein